MKKLYEQIPIETWKKIAYKVQRLKINDLSDKEFKNNLKLLQQLLSENIDVSLDLNKREPKKIDEIGLASLLYSIYKEYYNNKMCSKYAKAHFYEYIHSLDYLGISSMAFLPTGINDTLKNTLTAKTFEMQNYISKNKIYTDGTFKLKNYKYINECYDLINLENASFIINVNLKSEFGITSINNAYSIVKDFKFYNNFLPSKEEIINMNFPDLKVKATTLKWGESPEYSQVYDRLDRDKLNFTKRLTKTSKGIYYYKEYNK